MVAEEPDNDAAPEVDAAPEDEAAPEDDAAPKRRQTMGEISHTMPLSGDTLGELYRRGPAPTEDDGSAAAGPAPDDHAAGGPALGDHAAGGPAPDERPTMGTVDHTPRNEAVNHVWARGGRVGTASAAEKRAIARGDD